MQWNVPQHAALGTERLPAMHGLRHHAHQTAHAVGVACMTRLRLTLSMQRSVLSGMFEARPCLLFAAAKPCSVCSSSCSLARHTCQSPTGASMFREGPGAGRQGGNMGNHHVACMHCSRGHKGAARALSTGGAGGISSKKQSSFLQAAAGVAALAMQQGDQVWSVWPAEHACMQRSLSSAWVGG